MARRAVALVAAGCMLSLVQGFSVAPCALRSSGHNVQRQVALPSVARLALRPTSFVCKGAAEDLPQAKDLIGVGDTSTIEEWFEKLGDSRQSIRTMASMKIAEMHDQGGKEKEVINRLIEYLVLEDVHERRAAVQTLGMIGQKVLKPITDLLLTTEDRLVRSSCSKAIGAVALKNPELLPLFPQDALEGMKKAILDIPDPVTKIATIASLGQIGGGDMAYGFPGCERALDVLIDALSVTDDMGLAAAAVNAVATIGNTNEAFRPKCISCLEALKRRAKDVDGFFFVEQLVDSNLENLTGGGLMGELTRGRSSDNKAWLASASRQVDKAAKGGMIVNPDATPPPPNDDWMSKL